MAKPICAPKPSPSAARASLLVSLSAIAASLLLPTGPARAGEAEPITFASCGDTVKDKAVRAVAQCAQILVPENRAKPDGRKISLPILRVPAQARSTGEPVFFLTGGPGAGNLDEIMPLGAVHEQHDVYFVGYRGADGASALVCPEISKQLGTAPLLSPDGLEGLGAAAASCNARLSASGVDLAHYSMFDVIDDLEQVRNSLGIAKVNLFSISYGTRIAQYYARRFPGSMSRSAMFGANPPGHFVFSAYVNDRILDRLAEICAADKACSARTGDLKKTIRLALTAGERSGNPKIDDGAVRSAMFLMLYGRDTTKIFIDAALEAEGGDYAKLEQLSSLVTVALKGVIHGDMFAKGGTDAYRYPLLRESFQPSADSVGSPLDELYSKFLENWPVIDLPAQYRLAAIDRTPTLIVNGDLDVSTPLLFIEAELMPYLPNGQLIMMKDYGHNDYARQAEAFGEILAGFYGDGSVDRSRLKPDPFSFER